MTELYTDHCDTDGLGYVLERLQHLESNNHKPTVEERHVGQSRSKDRAYPIVKVTALPEPMGPDTDVVADEDTFWICGCDGHFFHYTGEDGAMLPPDEWEECPHIENITREKRAQNDNLQEQL